MEAIKRADMNREEATATCEAIRGGLDQMKGLAIEVRDQVLALHDRKGWVALGYETWKQCVDAEFDLGYRQVDRELQAARIEQEIEQAEVDGNGLHVYSHKQSPIENERLPSGQLRALAEVAPAQRREVIEEARATAPKGKVTNKHVKETADRKVGKPKPEPKPEIPRSQYKTEVNGQFAPDPPAIAKLRAAGKIGAGVVVEITEPEPDEEPEAEPAAELPVGITEDDWLAGLPLSSVLVGMSLAIFQSDARRYFRMKAAREAVRNRSQVAGKGLRKDGAYLRRIGGFLTTKDPRDWIRCPTIDNGGCGGTGQVEMVGACPHCYGRGYTIDNRREWRPSA